MVQEIGDRRDPRRQARRRDDFDQIGVVVDWLDACRKGDLTALLELYAEDATLECSCSGSGVTAGRAQIKGYWRPRMRRFSSTGFGLEEIMPPRTG